MKNLKESIEYKDMVGLIKPTVYVDEFQSKVGNDDSYIVLSFYVRNIIAADDLVHWFETGYPFVIDADRSPGEVRPNRYLVFVEIKRRTYLIDQLKELLNDLETLTEHKLEDWSIVYRKEEYPFDEEILKDVLILTPHDYRLEFETELNELRTFSNLPTKPIYDTVDDESNRLRIMANIPIKTLK